MESIKKVPGFIYLDKNGFYFFELGLTQVISLAFLATSVRDMDVISAGSIMGQVKGFVEQYKLVPAAICVILSPNITFEKDILNLDHEMQSDAIKKFLETVPFDNILSKEYIIEKGVKVIACNDDIYMELKMSFEKNACIIDSAVPYKMLGEDQQFIRNLTIDNASALLKRVDRLKQFSMISIEKEKTQIVQNIAINSEQPKPKSINKRLVAMAATFVVLFVILGFMLFNMK